MNSSSAASSNPGLQGGVQRPVQGASEIKGKTHGALGGLMTTVCSRIRLIWVVGTHRFRKLIESHHWESLFKPDEAIEGISPVGVSYTQSFYLFTGIITVDQQKTEYSAAIRGNILKDNELVARALVNPRQPWGYLGSTPAPATNI